MKKKRVSYEEWKEQLELDSKIVMSIIIIIFCIAMICCDIHAEKSRKAFEEMNKTDHFPNLTTDSKSIVNDENNTDTSDITDSSENTEDTTEDMSKYGILFDGKPYSDINFSCLGIENYLSDDSENTIYIKLSPATEIYSMDSNIIYTYNLSLTKVNNVEVENKQSINGSLFDDSVIRAVCFNKSDYEVDRLKTLAFEVIATKYTKGTVGYNLNSANRSEKLEVVVNVDRNNNISTLTRCNGIITTKR